MGTRTTRMTSTGMSYPVLLILVGTLRTSLAATCPSSVVNLAAGSLSVQEVSSPNYPFGYPNNQNCRWLIDSGSSGSTVIAYLRSLNIERGYDYLHIYNANYAANRIFYSQNGYSPALLSSTGQYMYITMTTDYSVTYTGFLLEYMAVFSPISCGTTLTASSTQNSFYADGSYGCAVTVTAGNSAEYIEITVPISQYDVVVSYASNSYTISRGTGAHLYLTNTVTVTMNYKSVVVYNSVGNTVATTATPTTTAPTAGSLCTTQTLNATSTEQFFTSQNYPSNFEGFTACDIVISSSNSTMAVQLRVVDIELGPFAQLNVYDGTTSFNFLGTLTYTNQSISSTVNAVHLYFTSGSYGTARGFRIGFSTITSSVPSCASSYSVTAVTTIYTFLSSVNYPGNYDSNHQQYWLLRKPSETDTIVLYFSPFNVESASSCRYDEVSIYDGPCTSDLKIGSLCGYQTHEIRDSSGIYVLVAFTTDSSVTLTGFRFTVYIDSSAAAASSTSSNVNNRIPYIVSGSVLGAILLGVMIVVFCKCSKKVAPSTTSAPPLPKKLTTFDLLNDVQKKAADQKPREKVLRKKKPSAPPAPGPPEIPKPQPRPPPPFPPSHPLPNPPGPNVNVFNVNQYGFNDTGFHPAPNIVGPYPGMNPVGPYPGMNPVGPYPFPSVPSGLDDPLYPPPPVINPATLPSPYKYVTPAEELSVNQMPRP